MYDILETNLFFLVKQSASLNTNGVLQALHINALGPDGCKHFGF
jgi:hypothetical protein